MSWKIEVKNMREEKNLYVLSELLKAHLQFFEQDGPHFYLAMGLTNYVAGTIKKLLQNK